MDNNPYRAPQAAVDDVDQNLNPDFSGFSEKWQKRFRFFQEHGAPNSPTYVAAVKELKFGQRLFFQMNWFVFFFGFVYLFIIGMWKRALALIGLQVVYTIITISFNISAGAAQGGLFGITAFFAMSTNYAYFCQKIRGIDGWNPFTNIQWSPPKK